MEALLEELSQLRELLDKMEAVDAEIEEKGNVENLVLLKQNLGYQLAQMCLDNRVKREGLTPELIRLYSALDVKRVLEAKVDSKNKDNQYNLESDTIVSKKTGEIISIRYMTISEKIKTIYEHTGEVMKEDDRIFNSHRDHSCQLFIAHLASTVGPSQLKERFGDNWEKTVAERYNNGYTDSIRGQIGEIVEKVNEENKAFSGQPIGGSVVDIKSGEEEDLRRTNQELSARLTLSEQKVSLLQRENSQLRTDNNLLKSRMSDMQQSHKKDMEELRHSLTSVIPYEQSFSNGMVPVVTEETEALGEVGFSK